MWLPAARTSSAGDAQPHRLVGGASAPPPPGHRRRGDVQRRQRADCCPRCERPASRWPPTSTAWSGSARKWGAAGRRYYRQAESLAVRWSDALIADAPGIQDYYRADVRRTHGADLLRSADRAGHQPTASANSALSRTGSTSSWHGSSRRTTSRRSSRATSPATRASRWSSSARLPTPPSTPSRFTPPPTTACASWVAVWDQDLLDQLYANAMTYVHGHSVGGTNPSLLRAIGAGAPTIAYDVVFNRGVLGAAGEYFRDAGTLARLLERYEDDGDWRRRVGRQGREIAATYDWDDVAASYEALLLSLMTSSSARSRRPSGRRVSEWTA